MRRYYIRVLSGHHGNGKRVRYQMKDTTTRLHDWVLSGRNNTTNMNSVGVVKRTTEERTSEYDNSQVSLDSRQQLLIWAGRTVECFV